MNWLAAIEALARDAPGVVWNAPATAGVLAAFETRHGVTLPADYKRVMTTLGNGCTGDFTLFPVGYARMGFADQPLEELTRGEGFDLSQPFPLATRGYWDSEPDAENDEANQDEDDDDDDDETEDPLERGYLGAVPVGYSSNTGGLALLVVNGKDHGLVWEHELGSPSLTPMPTPLVRSLSFTAWVASELAILLGRSDLLASWRGER